MQQTTNSNELYNQAKALVESNRRILRIISEAECDSYSRAVDFGHSVESNISQGRVVEAIALARKVYDFFESMDADDFRTHSWGSTYEDWEANFFQPAFNRSMSSQDVDDATADVIRDLLERAFDDLGDDIATPNLDVFFAKS